MTAQCDIIVVHLFLYFELHFFIALKQMGYTYT